MAAMMFIVLPLPPMDGLSLSRMLCGKFTEWKEERLERSWRPGAAGASAAQLSPLLVSHGLFPPPVEELPPRPQRQRAFCAVSVSQQCRGELWWAWLGSSYHPEVTPSVQEGIPVSCDWAYTPCCEGQWQDLLLETHGGNIKITAQHSRLPQRPVHGHWNLDVACGSWWQHEKRMGLENRQLCDSEKMSSS